jgi:hypothetical protein
MFAEVSVIYVDIFFFVEDDSTENYLKIFRS